MAVDVFNFELLSGTTNGLPIEIDATATPGTLMHTTPAGEATFDVIWLWAFNRGTEDVQLSIETGGASAAYVIPVNIAAGVGLVPILQGVPLNNGLAVTIYASTADVVSVVGEVHRITPGA